MKRLLLLIALGIVFGTVQGAAFEMPEPQGFCICPEKEPVCSPGKSAACKCEDSTGLSCEDCHWRCQ